MNIRRLRPRRLSRMLLATLLMPILSIPALASASPAVAADTLYSQFRGKFSVTYFEIPGVSPCTTIYGYLYGNSDINAQSSTAGTSSSGAAIETTVEATYIVYDHCNDTYLQIANGTAHLPGASGYTQPNLNRSKINTALSITDSAGVSIPVKIDVTFTGVGDPYSERSVTHNVGNGYMFLERLAGSFRFNSLAGTVTYGSTTYNLGQATYTDSYSGQTTQTTISVTRT